MKYLLAFLAAIGLVIVVFILLLRAFSGGGEPAKEIDLLSYANTNTEVRLSVDGPVSANQTHRGYRITVGRNDATIETTIGYEGQRTFTQTYASNVNAYATFLRALEIQGFTKGDTDPERADDRGYCPDGDRYAFEIVQNGKLTQRFWSTSCGKGTYGGNSGQTRLLFERQIPDFGKIYNTYGPRAL